MEKNRKSHLWYLLLLLPFGIILAKEKCTHAKDCTVLPENLSCYTNFNDIISCVWNSTYEHQDSVCTIETERQMNGLLDPWYEQWKSSCHLKSEDPSRPMQKTCTMFFKRYRFLTIDVCLINISCNTKKQVLSVPFKPSCHIKLNPPPKPEINLTTVVWFPQVKKHRRINEFGGELQLRMLDEPWRDPPIFKECMLKGTSCSMRLPDLIKGETYEARIRVQSTHDCYSSWSDWSPSNSWVATVGIEKPTPAPQALPPEAVTLGTVAVLVTFVLMIILVRTDRTTWVYIVKRIRGPPLPHPGKSFLQEMDFKNPKNPPFSSESFLSLAKPVEIAQVEVTSTPSAVVPAKLEDKTQGVLTVKDDHHSTSSSFSNPIYSHLSGQLPSALPLPSGNLVACGADIHVSCHGAEKDLEQDEQSVILRLLSEGNCDSTFVISDYEKVERAEMDRARLQSLDSGVGSTEEASQESLEPDSITKTTDEDGDQMEQEENDFMKIFGGGGVVDNGSIQVCSGYEQIQKLHSETAELLSLDSGIGSGCGRLTNHEDSLTEEEESVLLLPPPQSPVLRCSSSALASSALKRQGADFGGPGEMLEKTPLMSSDRAASGLEPSPEEYLPVRWELKTDAENL